MEVFSIQKRLKMITCLWSIHLGGGGGVASSSFSKKRISDQIKVQAQQKKRENKKRDRLLQVNFRNSDPNSHQSSGKCIRRQASFSGPANR